MAESLKLTFPNRAGEELAAKLELPDGRPVAYALFAHCFTCSKDSAAASRISRALGKRGFAVLRFDFTGLGNSEGDFANTSFSSNVEDLVAAADYLREHHVAPQLLIGHSLGGAAVLKAAPRVPECRAVATIAAPSEPEHLKNFLSCELASIEEDGRAEVELGGRRFTIQKQFIDDLEKHRLLDELRDLGRALMIFHSPVDNVVGIDHAQKIFVAARHPKSFVSLDDADHLLSRKEDSELVADVLSAWAVHEIRDGAPAAEPEPAVPHGTVVVEEVGPGYTQRVVAGSHTLVADEPESAGGTDAGPNPYDFLMTALGACTSMTLRMYANHKGLPLEHVAVRLRHEKVHAKDCEDCESQEGKIDEIGLELVIEGDLTPEQRERMVEIAHKCPVHRTLTSETKIRVKPVDELG